jgi:hypothetical protein
VTTPILLADQLGITYRRVDHWIRVGYLKVEGHGIGRPRSCPPAEVIVAHRMVELLRDGLTVATAAKQARQQTGHPAGPRRDWRDYAICGQADPELWMAEGEQAKRQAIVACRGCQARDHPLAQRARELCDHSTRPKYGTIACGQCWEQAIRLDDRQAVSA